MRIVNPSTTHGDVVVGDLSTTYTSVIQSEVAHALSVSVRTTYGRGAVLYMYLSTCF